MSTRAPAAADPFDGRVPLAPPPPLAPFVAAGLLGVAEVHVAERIALLCRAGDDATLLAAALAVRAPRVGSVCADLASPPAAIGPDDGAEPAPDLPWPDPARWATALATSPAVAVGEGGPADRPLRLIGTRIYLDRLWRDERSVAADLLAHAGQVDPAPAERERRIAELFPGEQGADQRLAAAAIAARGLAVVAGGPGTGKTTTVGRTLALIHEEAAAAGRSAPLIALCAPTGKAAARLTESVRHGAEGLPVPDATTIHRLLVWRPGSDGPFLHGRANPLPHDLVVVDETSMVGLPLMADLLAALRPDARLVLVGDPAQLASIEAGTVLGDIVAAGGPVAGCVTTLRAVHRYGPEIGGLADAIRAGDADGAVAALEGGSERITWISDVPQSGDAGLEPVRDLVVERGARLRDAAAGGRAREALACLEELRVLCAHRHGAAGVSGWTERIERWLSARSLGPGAGGRWYLARPLLITRNDYALGLMNGDTGVVIAGEDARPTAAFARREGVALLSPARLENVETVHAMTIHKGQGSQFETAVVVLPDADSPIATRELVYTAVTRARERLVVVGREESIRAAIARPLTRASGLRERLAAG